MTTTQAPISSRFDAWSTADDVIAGIDLTGSVVIVTGGASGIGVDTTTAMHAAGATVIVPARDVDRARTALAGFDGVETEHMDLMDPSPIDAFAERFRRSGRAVHTLICSAGIGGAPLIRDERGYESHFATNHLGHAQLVDGLWPSLVAANGARVVVVSSWAHRASKVVLDDPNYDRRPYDSITGYGQSKTANVLYALALDRRGAASGVRAFSLHPGSIVDTNFKRNTPPGLLEAAGMVRADGSAVIEPARGWKTVAQGAATTVWCATSPQLDGLGGLYAQDCEIAALLDHTDPAVIASANTFGNPPLGVMDYAVDPDAAEDLWSLSERLLGRALLP